MKTFERIGNFLKITKTDVLVRIDEISIVFAREPLGHLPNRIEFVKDIYSLKVFCVIDFDSKNKMRKAYAELEEALK